MRWIAPRSSRTSARRCTRCSRRFARCCAAGRRGEATMSAIAFSRLAELFAPVEHLLASGGDTRLRLDPATQLNFYGCRPYPRPEAFTFASSTATSISERGFAAAEAAREDLARAAARDGLETAVEAQVEALRAEL